MKMKNKVAIALTLALGSMTAQAQDKGMDINISMTPRAPTAPVAAPVTPQPAASKQDTQSGTQAGGMNLQALASGKPAAPPAAAMPAPVAKPTVASKPPVRVEPQKPVEPAQPAMATATPRQAPAATSTPAAVVAPSAPAAPTSQALGNTNPFTGKGLATEERQAQIESAKLDTELMIERLKQANLIADLTYLPLKKKAEVSSMPGLTAVASSTSKQADEGTAAAPKKAVKKATKKTAAKPSVAEAPVVKAPEPPRVSVTGVSINGNKASAILEVEGGGVFSANDGDQTPYGKVRVADAQTIYLGERRMMVRDSMLSRMYVSDPVPVDEKIRNNTVITAPPKPAAPSIPLPQLPPLPKSIVPSAPAPMPGR